MKRSPLDQDRVVPISKLHMVHIVHRETEVDAACCALGVQKTDQDPELLIYGKSVEPVLRVPLKAVSTADGNPIDVTAERTGDSGLITLTFAGNYQASFSVTDPDRN